MQKIFKWPQAEPLWKNPYSVGDEDMGHASDTLGSSVVRCGWTGIVLRMLLVSTQCKTLLRTLNQVEIEIALLSVLGYEPSSELLYS